MKESNGGPEAESAFVPGFALFECERKPRPSGSGRGIGSKGGGWGGGGGQDDQGLGFGTHLCLNGQIHLGLGCHLLCPPLSWPPLAPV